MGGETRHLPHRDAAPLRRPGEGRGRGARRPDRARDRKTAVGSAHRGRIGREQGRYFGQGRSEEHTSELQSLMRISYAVFCLKKKNTTNTKPITNQSPMSKARQ